MTLEHHRSILHEDGTPLPAFKHMVDAAVWTCWLKVPDPKKPGKFKKPPISPVTGLTKKWNAEGATGTYEQALDFAKKHGLPGVGISMQALRRAGFRIVGIDLDNAIGDDGKPLPWARDILRAAGKLESYAEKSPSGKGYRVLAEGDGAAIGADVEVYDGGTGRYLTITGDRMDSWPGDILPAPMTIAAALARATINPKKGTARDDANADDSAASADKVPPLADVTVEIIKSALDALPAADLHYDDWLRVLQGVHHQTEGSADGFALVDGWSMADGRYDATDLASKWAGFGKPRAGKPVTIKSLFKLAGEAGWVQPRVDDRWPSPESLTTKGALPDRGVIPARTLPDVLAQYAENGARRSGGDRLAAVGLIAPLLGALVPARVSFRPRAAPDYVVPATAYVALAGDVGVGKSACLGHLKRHVDKIENEHEIEYRRINARYKQGLDELKKATKSASKSAKGEDAADLPGGEWVEPVHPRPRRRTTTSVTPEGCARLVSRTGDGLLVLAEELAGFFGALDRYSGNGKTGSGDRAFWLTGYDGVPFSSHRANEDNNIHVPKLQCSIIGTIQWPVLAALRDVLGTDGLLQRFWILNLGKSVMSEIVEADMLGADVFEVVVRLLVDLGRDREDIVVVASSEAVDVSRKAEAWGLTKRDELPEDDVLRGVVAKTTGSVARLTIMLHCIWWAADQAEVIKLGLADEIDPLPLKVSGDVAQRAFDLWTQFYWPETMRAHRVASVAGVDRDVSDLADFVKRIARDGGIAFSARDVGQAIRRFRGEGRNALTKAAVKLEKAHWVRKGGKPDLWEVNPDLREAA